ncbi:MAG: hypothetical protein J6S67_24515 [Methanobrevibacter sp.]|nr:hypothetical protein [Methanobrevibacter sp.]
MKEIKLSKLDLETIDMYISYYNHHSVEKINKEHPGYVEADFTMILKILENALEV